MTESAMHERMAAPDTGFDVHLRRNADGIVRTYHASYEWDDCSALVWSEGNFSCDCNRALFFRRAAGEADPDDHPCGADRFTVLKFVLPDGIQVVGDNIKDFKQGKTS